MTICPRNPAASTPTATGRGPGTLTVAELEEEKHGLLDARPEGQA